jgi:hypothetical protein
MPAESQFEVNPVSKPNQTKPKKSELVFCTAPTIFFKGIHFYFILQEHPLGMDWKNKQPAITRDTLGSCSQRFILKRTRVQEERRALVWLFRQSKNLNKVLVTSLLS